MKMKNIAPIIFLFLCGCASNLFAPAYNAELDQAITQAHGHVSEITACIDLGLCKTAASFEASQSAYTKAIAKLKTAKILAESLAPSTITLAGENARDLLIAQIDGCQTQLVSMSKLHQAGTALPNIGLTQPVDAACDMALRASQALKQ